MVAAEALVGLGAAVATGQGHDPDDVRVVHQLLVEAVGLGQRELQHDELVGRQCVEGSEDGGLQQGLGLGLLRAVDVDLGLDDRHETRGHDLLADLELLVHHGLDAGRVGQLDDRAHLGAEHALGHGPAEELVEPVDRLHDLGTVDLVGQALVDLQERHDLLGAPEVGAGVDPFDLAVHGLLEEDRTEDPVTAEARARDDAGPHLVDEVVHRLVAGVLRLVDAVELQRLRRAAAALVEGGDEALSGLDLLKLCLVHAPGARPVE